MVNVMVVLQGVTALETDQLDNLANSMVVLLRAHDPAPVFWPKAEEVGMQFQLTEEDFGRLLQPAESIEAA